MKQFYNNPFASQLLAASSKMLTGLELPFLQSSIVKVEAPDEDNFEDAVESVEVSVEEVYRRSSLVERDALERIRDEGQLEDVDG